MYCREGERTLIIARTTQAKPKTALAGAMLEISFARFRASMAAFSNERALSRSFSCGEFVAMVVAVREWYGAGLRGTLGAVGGHLICQDIVLYSACHFDRPFYIE